MLDAATLEKVSVSNFRTDLATPFRRKVMLTVLMFVREHRGANRNFLNARLQTRYDVTHIEDAVQALAQRGGVEGITIIRRKGNENFTIRPKNSESVGVWEKLLREENPELFVGVQG